MISAAGTAPERVTIFTITPTMRTGAIHKDIVPAIIQIAVFQGENSVIKLILNNAQVGNEFLCTESRGGQLDVVNTVAQAVAVATSIAKRLMASIVDFIAPLFGQLLFELQGIGALAVHTSTAEIIVVLHGHMIARLGTKV